MVPVTTIPSTAAFGLKRWCLGETSEDMQSRLLDDLLAWLGEDLFFSWWKTLQGTICTTVWMEKVACKAKLAGSHLSDLL